MLLGAHQAYREKYLHYIKIIEAGYCLTSENNIAGHQKLMRFAADKCINCDENLSLAGCAVKLAAFLH